MSKEKTPAQILGDQEPFARDVILKMSDKWTKRTKGALIKWPKGGVFDVGVIEELWALVLNHKQMDKSNVRQETGHMEFMILSKFYVQALKEKAEMEKMWKMLVIKTPEWFEKELSQEERPPQYAPGTEEGHGLGATCRGEIDPPPWDSGETQGVLLGEKGLYPVLIGGTFKVAVDEVLKEGEGEAEKSLVPVTDGDIFEGLKKVMTEAPEVAGLQQGMGKVIKVAQEFGPLRKVDGEGEGLSKKPRDVHAAYFKRWGKEEIDAFKAFHAKDKMAKKWLGKSAREVKKEDWKEAA